MRQLLEEFRDALLAQGYDTKYYYSIRTFITYLELNNLTFNTLDRQGLNRFFVELTETMQNSTVNNFIKAIKKFYDFLFAVGVITDDNLSVVKDLRYLKETRKVKPYITEKDIYQIVEMGKEFCTWITPEKYEAVFWFLFYTGLRKGEFLNLKRSDINLKDMLVFVREPKASGNIRIERVVPFTYHVKKHLLIYFAQEEEKLNAFNFTSRQIQYLISKLKEFCPGKNFSLHSLRHSFARNCHEKGIDIKTLQKLLGHTSLQSTEIYVDPDVDTCIKIYRDKINETESRRKRRCVICKKTFYTTKDWVKICNPCKTEQLKE